MGNAKFHLDVSFSEKTGDPVAAYLRVREGKVARTAEISPGIAFADYGSDGVLLGIELLGPCRREVIERVSEQEPELVRKFLCDGVRKEMILA